MARRYHINKNLSNREGSTSASFRRYSNRLIYPLYYSLRVLPDLGFAMHRRQRDMIFHRSSPRRRRRRCRLANRRDRWCKSCSSHHSSTPAVNFINVLRAAFAPVDPKCVKRYWQLDWILTLLGATGVKAVHKYVGEIEPWGQFHQHFTRAFFDNIFAYVKVTLSYKCRFCMRFLFSLIKVIKYQNDQIS